MNTQFNSVRPKRETASITLTSYTIPLVLALSACGGGGGGSTPAFTGGKVPTDPAGKNDAPTTSVADSGPGTKTQPAAPSADKAVVDNDDGTPPVADPPTGKGESAAVIETPTGGGEETPAVANPQTSNPPSANEKPVDEKVTTPPTSNPVVTPPPPFKFDENGRLVRIEEEEGPKKDPVIIKGSDGGPSTFYGGNNNDRLSGGPSFDKLYGREGR